MTITLAADPSEAAQPIPRYPGQISSVRLRRNATHPEKRRVDDAAARAPWNSAVPAKVGQRRARLLSGVRSSLVMRAEQDRAVSMQRGPRDTARSESGHSGAVTMG